MVLSKKKISRPSVDHLFQGAWSASWTSGEDNRTEQCKRTRRKTSSSSQCPIITSSLHIVWQRLMQFCGTCRFSCLLSTCSLLSRQEGVNGFVITHLLLTGCRCVNRMGQIFWTGGPHWVLNFCQRCISRNRWMECWGDSPHRTGKT